ncbi:MAG: hypothetical protein WJ306_10555 [Ferrovum myxofaciens]
MTLVRVWGLWACLWAGSMLGGGVLAAEGEASPNVAFYLGTDAPLDLLQAFDEVIVDPAVFALPSSERYPHTRWAARVEITQKDYQGTPAAWLEKTLAPLWGKGFRDFYLTDKERGGDSFFLLRPVPKTAGFPWP